jgi:hypothetical protein
MNRKLATGLAFTGLALALGVGSIVLEKKGRVEAAAVQAPMFEVDPLWPKPLPNHWLIGMTIGVSVDAQDNVWIIHRQGSLEAGEQHATTNPPIAMCCAPAPPILEFDQAGNLLHHWAGRAKATIGRIRITESQSTTKEMFGSAATGAASRRRSQSTALLMNPQHPLPCRIWTMKS